MENFDKNIQEMLNSYTEQPSADCWNKLNSQLDKLQMQNSNTSSSSSTSWGGNTSSFSQFIGSIAGKVVSAVVAAAVIGGIVTWIVVHLPQNSIQTENETAVISEDLQNEQLSLNEANTQNTNEKNPLSIENGNTIFEHTTHSSEEHKDTGNYAENTPVSALHTAQNTTVNQTVQSETEHTVQKETASKTENNSQPATKEPKKRMFANTSHSSSDEKTVETEEIQQNRIEPPRFFIPNMITPNGDGVNDYFVIENIEQFSENQLYICNRYGTVIYEKSNYKNNWGAENIPDGVYYYVFKYVYQGVEFMCPPGSITVKRK